MIVIRKKQQNKVDKRPQITVLGTERLITVEEGCPPLLAQNELVPLGKPSADQPQILLSVNAFSTIVSHTTMDMSRELGGFLVGRPYRWQGQVYIEIVAAIRGEETVSSAVHLTISPNTWLRAQSRIRSEFPDYYIVGWYHTHPHMGVFFSPMDIGIHEGFFREPWHIALVVEPAKHSAGFFIWENKQIVLADGYYMEKPIEAKPQGFWQAPVHYKSLSVESRLQTFDNFYQTGFWHTRWQATDELAVRISTRAMELIKAETNSNAVVLIGACLGQIHSHKDTVQPIFFVEINDILPFVSAQSGDEQEIDLTTVIKQKVADYTQRGEILRLVGLYYLQAKPRRTSSQIYDFHQHLVTEFSQILLAGNTKQGVNFCCWRQTTGEFIERKLVELRALPELMGEGLKNTVSPIADAICNAQTALATANRTQGA